MKCLSNIFLSKPNKLTIVLVILFNLSKSNGCFGSFKSSSNNEYSNTINTRDLTDYYNTYPNESVSFRSKILIDSAKTCNKSLLDLSENKNQRYFHCFHNGKCRTIHRDLNSTHYERISFCVCQKVGFEFNLKGNSLFFSYRKKSRRFLFVLLFSFCFALHA
jgi:hypothetical protein